MNPPIPSKTRAILANEYEFSTRTLRRQLKSRLPEIQPRQLITAGYQKLIYETIGWPGSVRPGDYDEIPLPRRAATAPAAR